MTSWEDKLFAVFDTLKPEAPKPGTVPALLLELYFGPKTGQDIWTQLKAGTGNYVHPKSFAFKLKNLQPDLENVQKLMKNYIAAKPESKGGIFKEAVPVFEAIYKKCTSDEDASVQLLPATLAIALLHLSWLREAVVQEKVLFKVASKPPWNQILESQVKNYKNFFANIYPLWKEWRTLQIATEDTHTEFTHQLVAPDAPPDVEYFRVEDAVVDYLGGRNVNFIAHIYDFSDDPFTSISAQSMKSRLFNDMNAEFMRTFQLTYALNKFIPGKEQDPPIADPVSGVVGAGPFSVVLSDGEHLNQYRVDNIPMDKSGVVTGVVVREGGVIDALQFLYKYHEGKFVGNKQGGRKRKIDVKGKHITEIKMGFANYIMAEIEICFSDGTSTGNLGNWVGWAIEDRFRFTAGGIGKDFQLVSSSLSSANSTSAEAFEGIFQAEFSFLHVSLDPVTSKPFPSVTKATKK